MLNYTMETPKNFNAFVGNTLKAYRKNGPNMLVAIFYATVDQVHNHRNTTKLQQIVDAVGDGADESIVTSIVRKLVDGVNVNKDGKVTLAKEVTLNLGNAQIVLDAMNAETTFRNQKFLESLGLRVGKTGDFSLENWAKSAVSRLASNEVDLARAIQALKEAHAARQAKDKPVYDTAMAANNTLAA